MSSDRSHLAVSSPSIVALRDGRYISSYDEYTADRASLRRFRSFIATSDDHGRTWVKRHELGAMQGRLFTDGDAIYYLGVAKDLVASRSRDGGMTWTDTVKLSDGSFWHQTAANVWYSGGNVYLATEKITSGVPDTWQVPWLAPVLMKGRLGSDLLRRDSWQFATDLPFCEVIPGFKVNQPQIDFFGVPFFQQEYPYRHHIGNARMMHPLGWLEANVVQIEDHSHYWWDPERRTFHLLMRANTGGSGYAALLKVVEHSDGRMSTTLQTSPSGRKQLFTPMPGGHLRFHLLYDNVSRLYWLLSNQSTDSMRRAELLPDTRNGLPCNERNRLVLHFSKNVVDWCFAGVVDIGETDVEVRCYASMCIDNEDLAIACRSGTREAISARDPDIITFHRVKSFRDLAY